MCGIIGSVGKFIEEEQAAVACSTLEHRGPNDAGIFYDAENKIFLGHRRLSIIDLSPDGHQPFLSEDGRYVLVFNGEIYNYIELKEELKDLYNFKTKSDTEVLLASYIIWGDACLKKFNGMFSFALWDKKESRLFCARDHLGIKPFFYHFQNGVFSFASEIKALFPLGVAKKENEKIIFDYLSFGLYDHTTETFFQDIHVLAGGHSLTWKNNEINIEQYWDINPNLANSLSHLSEEEVKKEFKFLLADSIRMQFRSDVPIGINLSSGLDSNSLLYYARSFLNFDTHTFSMCLPDENFNECTLIEPTLLPEQKKIWHQCFLSPEDVFSLAIEMNKIQDQPYGGIPTIAYGTLNKEAKKQGITVLLEGQGLDEMLGGYEYYKLEHLKDISGKEDGDTSLNFSQDLTKLVHTTVLHKDFLKRFSERVLTFKKPFSSHLLNAQYRDLMYTKLPRVLRFNDHVSMAYSRELRVPYLDYRIVEFCFSLPPQYKINENGQKVLMREVMNEYLPKVINNKPKKAYGAIQNSWLRNYHKNEVMDIVGSTRFRNRPYWDYEELMKKIEDFYEGNGSNSFFLWQCINLELWFREFID